jgi:hypothetical protein
METMVSQVDVTVAVLEPSPWMNFCAVKVWRRIGGLQVRLCRGFWDEMMLVLFPSLVIRKLLRGTLLR